ncbi:MAG: type I DNA topoisomerase [Candidatus Eiseniibacteriota bacterium]
MAKSLVIVESPAKAKTINKYLGRNFVVKASMGHVKDLPKSKLGVDVEHGFEPEFITIRGKSKVIKELRDAAKKVESIYLATDLDREGEAIAAHLAELLSNGEQETYRVTFNEITQSAIREAFAEPGRIDRKKVDAQMARRILDRLVGYLISPLLWKVVTYGTSAGRVQTVALRLICEREEEIEAFRPEEYWTIDATYVGDAGQPFAASVKEVDGAKAEIADGDTARAVGARVRDAEHVVQNIEKKTRRRRAQAPFITSTLQQDASRRLGFSTRKTMMLAQQLYEGIDVNGEGPVGLITYMRTDSVRTSDEAIRQVRDFVDQRFGREYVPETPNAYKSKGRAQEAHEAIRPTDVQLTPDRVQGSLTRDQFRMYELIWQRFVASQMTPAVVDQTGVDILARERGAAGSSKGIVLRATGSIIAFPGHLAAYAADRSKAVEDERDRILPPLAEGEALRLVDPGVVEEQHFTQPPPRYSEASLVKTLEEEGIGRPSTYAAIISTLDARKYVERISGRFQPTELGKTVLRVLLKGFADIFETKFTAKMEEELDRIEAGDDAWAEVVSDFYGPFRSDLAAVEAKVDDLKKELEEKTEHVCSKCGSPMIIKWGRNGRFLACSGYPDCKNTAPVDGVKETDEVCEQCGSRMVVKEGRFGRFLACSSYPDCRYTKSIGVGVKCPNAGCGGEIVPRRAKKSGRTFYGCSKYPTCDFVTWDRPVDTACENCGHPYMVEKIRSAGSVLRCPECKAEGAAA